MNGVAEGVRQIRGTSVNQVDDVEHVLVTAGTGVPTSGLILESAMSDTPRSTPQLRDEARAFLADELPAVEGAGGRSPMTPSSRASSAGRGSASCTSTGGVFRRGPSSSADAASA